MPEPKEVVVVPSSPVASPTPIVGSPLVNPSFGSMFRGALSSLEDSFQREDPSLINGVWTSSHSLSFDVTSRPTAKITGVATFYNWITSPPHISNT
ncbi:unnamed protein product [Lactuca saligna]|uniref:Uncharacterized protein n=1 Tax=Lactuca saligna TaxID=75948 RepID=A0AA35Z3U2_LACSI|nr:unnamed protein product [Lactuca saligna]